MPQFWRALSYDIDADRLVARTLPAGSAAAAALGQGPARLRVVVIGSDEAAVAAGALTQLKGRRQRVKDERKGLAGYVPARAQAVHVCASYTHPGQAERGVRDLAGSAAGRRWPGLYLLEVNGRLFDQLWARACFAAKETPGTGQTGRGGLAPAAEEMCELDGDGLALAASLRKAYVGDSRQAEDVRRRIVMASKTDHTVLIIGETGTGKEIVARQIHALGRRRHEPFVTMNCAAVAHDLFESELFGHVRGAFTGATSDKAGLYALAEGGTLFLDEVGDLHPAHQAKVLRVLNDGEYHPVGSERIRTGNARILAATNRSLGQMVEAGTFREDLFYRLLFFFIETPALRTHPGDIPTLAEFLWPTITAKTACMATLSPAVLDMLKTYPWQGNVRELRAFLANLSTLAGPAPLTPALVNRAFRAWTRVKTSGEDR